MNTRHRALLKGTLLALVLAGVWLLHDQRMLARRAPLMDLQTVSGERFQLGPFPGAPTLINFWSTSCSTCVAEIPDLIALYQELSPAGFRVVGIALHIDPPAHVVSLARGKGIPYPLVADIQRQAEASFGFIQATPTSFLITRDGHIDMHIIGPIPVERVRQRALELLAET